jgi:hypothetical protein
MHAARCHQYLMQSVKVKIIELEKVQFSAEAESYIVGGQKGVNLPYRHGSVDSCDT